MPDEAKETDVGRWSSSWKTFLHHCWPFHRECLSVTGTLSFFLNGRTNPFFTMETIRFGQQIMDSLRKKKSSQEEDQACHQTSKLDRELFLVWRLLLFYNPGSWKPWEFSCNWLPHNFPAMDSLITDRRKRRKKKVSGQFFNQGILTGIRGRAVLILPGIDKRERREELARQLLRT